MKKNDIKVKINVKLWEMAQEKIKADFGKKMSGVDTLLIVSLLYLYKSNSYSRDPHNLFMIDQLAPDDLRDVSYRSKTICVYADIMAQLKKSCGNSTNSYAIERALVDYLYLPLTFYTDKINPVYTFVGSKNLTMQSATANAVEQMHINHHDTILVDACCGTGSLFLGLHTYQWKSVILNDMNPVRTNFLNVLKCQPLEFVKFALDDELWMIDTRTSDRLNFQKKFKTELEQYYKKRKHYHKVDKNVSIAYATLLYQSWEGQFIDDKDKIFQKILKILPASLKLQNATITQEDGLTYLDNANSNKLVLLDPPYIGTEKECCIEGYDYNKFHEKVSEKLSCAEFPFLYFCRSSAPKSDKLRSKKDKERIMKMKLGLYFFNKGYFFQKIHLKEDTELIICNRQYNSQDQFQWTDFTQKIL